MLINSREVNSRYGHIVVIGVHDAPLARAASPEELRSIVVDHGGAMIIAHPFRHYPSSWNLLFPGSRDHWGPPQLAEWPPERLAGHPVFGLVDAVEVLNTGCTPGQNELAYAVACARGLPAVGASDAHDVYALGWYATAFDVAVSDDNALAGALRAGRVRPVWRSRSTGTYEPIETLFGSAK